MPQVLNFQRVDPEQMAAVSAAFDLLRAALRRANIECNDDVVAAEMIGIASAGACDPRWLCIATLKILARRRQLGISEMAVDQGDHSIISPAVPSSARVFKRS